VSGQVTADPASIPTPVTAVFPGVHRAGAFEIRSDRRYQMDTDRESVWKAISSVEKYSTWWPWLREFSASALVAGDRWKCVVQPPLPYLLRFTVSIDQVEAPALVLASVDGDVRGVARLDLCESDERTEVHVRSLLAPASRLLRAMSVLARPIARFGHDWVFDTGARQFAERAL
jgi:uncharacterized protein YndB with AHSA1/START domain